SMFILKKFNPVKFLGSAYRIQLLVLLLLAGLFQRASAACDLSATTTNFGSQIAAAVPGQTVCLASGTYGKFVGVQKSSPGVTITPQPGATVSMSLWFAQTSPVPAWLILDGITFTGGTISGPTHDVTFKNSTFTDKLDIYQNSNNNRCSNCPAL